MKLGTLIAGADYAVEGSLDVDVTGIAYDSRHVEAGNIFFALARTPGRTTTILMRPSAAGRVQW